MTSCVYWGLVGSKATVYLILSKYQNVSNFQVLDPRSYTEVIVLIVAIAIIIINETQDLL